MKLNTPIYRVLNSENKTRVLQYMLTNKAAEDMSERRLAMMLDLSNVSVNRALNDFESINLVYCTEIGTAHVWKVNKDSLAYKALKNVFDNEDKGIFPVADMIKRLKKVVSKLPVIRVVIFGSVARKEERDDSDIDLFVLVKNVKDGKKAEEALEKTRKKFWNIYGNSLSPYIKTEKGYKEVDNKFLKKDIEKGIKII